MIDCDCQGSQLGVSSRRYPNKGLHRASVTLAGFVCLGPASKTRQETLAFLMSGPGPRADAGCLITFIRTTQSGDRSVAQMDASARKLHTCRQPDTNINIQFNYKSQLTQYSTAAESFSLIFNTQSPVLFPFPKR